MSEEHAVPKGLPFPPMEAQLVRELPDGDGWQYEPKWDGFRGVLENLGGGLRLWSRNERPLLRYFPELAELGERLPAESALDGEVVIERDGRLSFESLQMRLHPAESRITRLSQEIPASYVVFDVLVWEGDDLHGLPLEERRTRVEKLPFAVSPATRDRAASFGVPLRAATHGTVTVRLTSTRADAFRSRLDLLRLAVSS